MYSTSYTTSTALATVIADVIAVSYMHAEAYALLCFHYFGITSLVMSCSLAFLPLQVLLVIPHAQVSHEPPKVSIQPMPLSSLAGCGSQYSQKVRRHIDNAWCTKAMRTFLVAMKDRDVWNTAASMHALVCGISETISCIIFLYMLAPIAYCLWFLPPLVDPAVSTVQ